MPVQASSLHLGNGRVTHTHTHPHTHTHTHTHTPRHQQKKHARLSLNYAKRLLRLEFGSLRLVEQRLTQEAALVRMMFAIGLLCLPMPDTLTCNEKGGEMERSPNLRFLERPLKTGKGSDSVTV